MFIECAPPLILETCYQTAAGTLMDPMSPYNQLAQRTRALCDAIDAEPESETKEQRWMGAMTTPAIAFLVDTALDTVEQPAIAEQMPADTYKRAIQIMKVVEHAATTAGRSGLLTTFYRQNEHLKDVAPQEVIDATGNVNYLLSYGVAPIRETCCVAGGAARAMRVWTARGRVPDAWQGLTIGSEAEVIGVSSGLQIVASLASGKTNRATDFLGRPYASTGRFVPAVAIEAPVIKFSKRTLEHLGALLRQAPHGGCPVRFIASGTTPKVSVLEDSWARIVRNLIPPNARTEMSPRARPKKGELQYI